MNFSIGDLSADDLDRGFLDTLGSLAQVQLTADEAVAVLQQRLLAGLRTFVARVGDKTVGTVSLLVEQKFIHHGGRVGHVEDVAVHQEHQKQGIGAALVRHAVEEARRLGCYKVILNCTEANMPFYARLGFRRHEEGMRLDT